MKEDSLLASCVNNFAGTVCYGDICNGCEHAGEDGRV